MMNEATNRAMEGVMLCSDDPSHRQLRGFCAPADAAALAPLKARLQRLAEQRVDILLERKQFRCVADLAHLLPLTVVTELGWIE